MILKSLCLFSQNVRKNRTLTNIILENKKYFDILFIQEPLWLFTCTILSSSGEKEDKIVGAPNYPNWITFSRFLLNGYNYPRVLIYINKQLIHLCFSLIKGVFDHRDINCFSFFNNGCILFIVLIMDRNFNIRDRE